MRAPRALGACALGSVVPRSLWYTEPLQDRIPRTCLPGEARPCPRPLLCSSAPPAWLQLEPPLRRRCPLPMQVRASQGLTHSGLALNVAGVCRGWCVLGPALCSVSRALSPSHQFLISWPGTHSLLRGSRGSQLTCPLPREASPAPHPVPRRKSLGPQVWLGTRGGAQGLDGRKGL